MADAKRTCTFPGCDEKHHARGLCRRHYRAALRRDELPESWEPRHVDREAQFWAKVDKTGDCWNWAGYIATTGYGQFGRHDYAHRYSLELATGAPLDSATMVDHTCHNRRCVNPDHLRPATNKQNCENLRGANRTSKSGIRGVWFAPTRGKWVAQVRDNGRRHSGGYHLTREAAERAAIALRNTLFTHNDADRK